MTKLVIVDYADLLPDRESTSTSSTLLSKLEEAYGKDGLGILGIRGVPKFQEMKQRCLPLAHSLAHLDPAELSALEDPDSFFNAGWSHGKEMIRPGFPDKAKASFYFNPLVDIPGTPEERSAFPASYPCNKWPKKSLPDLETACKDLGGLLKDVALALTPHLDRYVEQKQTKYPSNFLQATLETTEKVKGRLLYYYPLPQTKKPTTEVAVDSWIGFHNDSGYLTCLAGDLYLNPDGTVLPMAPSPDTGLYIEDRHREVHHVRIPPDCMAIQIGECSQIVSGGALTATPHCVKGAPNSIRVSLACFVDVPPTTPIYLPEGSSKEDLFQDSSKLVPPLQGRWTNGMTFGDFLAKTFATYYEWNDV